MPQASRGRVAGGGSERRAAISTCTFRSARTGAATATSSRPSAASTRTAATSTHCSPSSSWNGRGSPTTLETIFVGGGTPTFTEPTAARAAAGRVARGAGGHGRGESGDSDARARGASVTKPCQSCVDRRAELPHAAPRGAGAPRAARGRPPAVHLVRDAGFDNISLDLLYGIPGQSAADLDRDLAEALALEPEHLSCYELEAKPGTRFTHAHGGRAGPPGRRRWRATSSASSRC